MSTIAKTKIVKQVEDLSNAVNDMHKAMETTPTKQEERKMQISEFQKKHPDVKYIEPSQRIPTGASHCPAYHKAYGSLEYLLEYVTGIFESQLVGATFEFDLGTIPGEDFCRWSIPTNKPIGVPRFVAKHLGNNLAWREMKPLGNNQEPTAVADYEITKPFQNFEMKRRGTFHPLNAY
jgi:hypothetical protein